MSGSPPAPPLVGAGGLGGPHGAGWSWAQVQWAAWHASQALAGPAKWAELSSGLSGQLDVLQGPGLCGQQAASGKQEGREEVTASRRCPSWLPVTADRRAAPICSIRLSQQSTALFHDPVSSSNIPQFCQLWQQRCAAAHAGAPHPSKRSSDSELVAVPAALSCCTQLTRLDLAYNELADGWQHLQPLTQLRHLLLISANDLAAGSHHLAALRLLRWLDLSQCGLAEVPAAVSALTALQHSDLFMQPI